jgi:hypothetical protein
MHISWLPRCNNILIIALNIDYTWVKINISYIIPHMELRQVYTCIKVYDFYYNKNKHNFP